jgi:hypothetical protein
VWVQGSVPASQVCAQAKVAAAAAIATEEAAESEQEQAAKRAAIAREHEMCACWVIRRTCGPLKPVCCSFGAAKERVGKYTGKSQKERDAIFRKGEHKKRASGQADRNNFVEAEKRLLRQVVDPMSSGASWAPSLGAASSSASGHTALSCVCVHVRSPRAMKRSSRWLSIGSANEALRCEQRRLNSRRTVTLASVSPTTMAAGSGAH